MIDSSTGYVFGCSSTGNGGFSVPQAAAVYSSYGYILSNNASSSLTLLHCTLSSSTGLLSGCVSAGQGSLSGLTSPRAMYQYGGLVYVVTSTAVSKCAFEGLTGLVTLCSSASGSGFSTPYDIYVLDGFAYIANSANNTVSSCAVNLLGGDLSSCATTGSGFSAPQGIVIKN